MYQPIQTEKETVTDYDEVIKRLPGLNREQLRAVQMRVGFLSTMAKSGDDTSDELLALECVSSVLRSKGMEFAAPSVLRKNAAYDSFRTDKVPAVMAYLQKARFTRNETRAILHLGLGLLIADMQRMGIMTSARAVMAHFHRLPAVLNHAFPGYAEGGALAMIIRRKR
jgi:hypothetical protein